MVLPSFIEIVGDGGMFNRQPYIMMPLLLPADSNTKIMCKDNYSSIRLRVIFSIDYFRF